MDIISLIIRIFVVIAAITIHEFSHALAAYHLGDDTAKRYGRLTLNPIKHFDLFGTIMLLIFRIGWAKGVPINPYNFRDMKRDMALSAAAGPASNFIVAILAAMVLRLVLSAHSISFFTSGIGELMYRIPPNTSQMVVLFVKSLLSLVQINLILGLFNLIPIPPTDGSKIIGWFMPDEMYFKWASFERNGMFLFIMIFMICRIANIPLFSYLVWVPAEAIMKWLIGI